MTSLPSLTAVRDLAPAPALPFFAALSILARDMVVAIGAWRRRRKAIADLRFLDDRCLMDMGIDRADIPTVVASRGADKTRRYY